MDTYTNILPADTLRHLCIENNWFTAGTNEQYSMLFKRCERGASLDELAIIIWTCSKGVENYEILATLKKAALCTVYLDGLADTLTEAGYSVTTVNIVCEALKTHPENGISFKATV